MVWQAAQAVPLLGWMPPCLRASSSARWQDRHIWFCTPAGDAWYRALSTLKTTAGDCMLLAWSALMP